MEIKDIFIDICLSKKSLCDALAFVKLTFPIPMDSFDRIVPLVIGNYQIVKSYFNPNSYRVIPPGLSADCSPRSVVVFDNNSYAWLELENEIISKYLKLVKNKSV